MDNYVRTLQSQQSYIFSFSCSAGEIGIQLDNPFCTEHTNIEDHRINISFAFRSFRNIPQSQESEYFYSTTQLGISHLVLVMARFPTDPCEDCRNVSRELCTFYVKWSKSRKAKKDDIFCRCSQKYILMDPFIRIVRQQLYKKTTSCIQI